MLSFFFVVFASVLKLAAAPVLLVPLGLGVALVLREQAAAIPIGRIVLVCGLFAPWMARNVLVSGYLVYPAVASCLPVPWAAVREAAGNAAANKGWALGFRSAPDIGKKQRKSWDDIPITETKNGVMAHGSKCPASTEVALNWFGP